MANLYKVDKNTLTATDNSSYIEAGIHEDIVMVDVKYSQTVNGNEFLAFYFENKHGDKLSHTEWPVKLSKPLESMSKEEKEKILGIVESQKSRIKQIVEVFFTDEELEKKPYEIDPRTFEEFAKMTIAFLGNAYKDKLVRVKVVYDYKGYTSLPNRSRFTFIEPMTISKEESKIRILTGDVLERPKKDTDPLEENPIETPNDVDRTTNKADSSDDLPF